MSKNDDSLEVEAVVTHKHGRGAYTVQLIDDEEVQIRVRVSGKMSQRNIQVVEGDKVVVKFSKGNPTSGTIVYRRR